MAANPIPQFQPEPNLRVLPNVENQVRQANTTNKKRVSERQRKIRFTRKMILAVALFVSIFPILQIANQINSLISVQKMTSESKTNYADLQKQNSSLKLQNKNLDNPDYLEQVLRDKYHYTKSGETLFNLPDSALSN